MKFFNQLPAGAEFFRFVAVGAVNTFAGYGLYWVLLLVLPYLAAYTVSYAAGICLSYWLNCRFVFRRKPTWSGAVRFPLVYVVQYLLSVTLLAVFVERLRIDQRLAAAVVACCSMPITFALSRWIIRPAARSERA